MVVLSVDPSSDDLSGRLSRVTTPGVTVVLLLPAAAGDLPVGRLAQAACSASLAFVEMAPIEPGWSVRTMVVCRPSSQPVAVRPYLGDDSVGDEDTDLDKQGLRIGWEWGLGDGRARAVEERSRVLQTRIDELEHELVSVQNGLETAHQAAERSERRATAEAARRDALQRSPTFLVGRAVVTMRTHPVRGLRQFLGAIRRSLKR